MARRELVVISFNPGASIRDKELASSSARSHVARVCHRLRSNRFQSSRPTDKGILSAARKPKRVCKLGSIAIEDNLEGILKTEKIACSSHGISEHPVPKSISKTNHTSESTSISKSRISRQRPKTGLQKKCKGKLQPSREQSARALSGEFSSHLHIHHYTEKARWALDEAYGRTALEVVIPGDRAGFRIDPFSTYPVRFQRSIPEALDYC